ncbi:TrbC family F-type conjugative pilus assembly protein [Rhodanobacter denitrificans]|uniref:Type-F conjugative transfer system pilin assembly protein n=1 Tax=Rhodanobacter denitrificans TaxID=666685 RepID=M4NE93_9GAMM|nr:TrbC family F-type conjugative pilus assembly protein [Rhodanobacter denitrificans]AGG89115.1 Type-F conjugative transfer system pilin assembly protein [Rhodanobacter denitrificans]UJJ52939.1 hypothetical protein LRK52_18725 [Rhodanobacter denitrificans]
MRPVACWLLAAALWAALAWPLAAQDVRADVQAQAAAALRDGTAAKQRVLQRDRAALTETISTANAKRDAQLQAMYRDHLPANVKAAEQKPGTRILMFASMSMTRTDMHGMMEAALADPRVTIEFIGGPRDGGVGALMHWLNDIAQGMKERPAIAINPPDFEKYHVAEVPYAVVVRDGAAVARVGGVVSPKWIDSQLATRDGDLGTYGRMSSVIEENMTAYLADRVKHFDWSGYTQRAVAGFWRGLAMPSVPHASTSETYQIDPTITVTHDIRTPDGIVLARAGQKVNPLDTAPIAETLLVFDASDADERAFARHQVQLAAGKPIVAMSTTVPATAGDGWATWRAWQAEVGTHLFAYLPAMAKRLNLTGSPSIVRQEGRLLTVQQIALPRKEAP